MVGPMQPIKSVGFVGLGVMGAPMAARLVDAGFRVRVHDVDRSRVDAFTRDHGAQAAATLAEAADGAEAVVTMLPDGGVVRRVVLGEPEGEGDRLLDGLGTGTILIDTTSSEPIGTRRLAGTLAESGIALVDAPVSAGGAETARDGTLTIMAGGDDEAAERARPLLEAMGSTIIRTGPIGTGHALKACNNTLASINFAATVEALMVGKRFGVAPDVMLDALDASSGHSRITERTIRGPVLDGVFADGFILGYQVKNIRGATELAETMGIEATLFRLCLDRWTRALDDLGPGVDFTEVVRVWQGDAGEPITPTDDTERGSTC